MDAVCDYYQLLSIQVLFICMFEVLSHSLDKTATIDIPSSQIINKFK